MKQSKKIKYDIAVIGDCVRDMFVVAPAKLIPAKSIYGEKQNYLAYPYGDKIPVTEVHYDLGGSACNAAVGLRKVGLRVAFGSVIGNAVSRKQASAILKKYGIDDRYMYRGTPQDRGFSLVMMGPDRDRTIFVYREKNDYSIIDLDRMLSESDAMYIAGIESKSEKILPAIIDHMCCKDKALYVNPSGYQLQKKNQNKLKELLKHTEIVCMNLVEAATLIGHDHNSPKQLLDQIHKLGPRIVVITFGKEGAICFDGSNYYRAGIWKTKRIDTTGAGDAFFSTFVGTYIKTKDVKKALAYGTINASKVVTEYGGQKGLFSWRDLVNKANRLRLKVTQFT